MRHGDKKTEIEGGQVSAALTQHKAGWTIITAAVQVSIDFLGPFGW